MFKRKKKRSREFRNSEKIIDLEQARTDRRQKRKQAVNKKQGKGQQAASKELSERKVNKRNRKRLIYVGIVLGILLLIGASIFHVYSLQQEYKSIVAQNKALQARKQDLTEELSNVNNPEYIEQQARQQLRMVKPGEVLYVLPPQDETGSAIVPQTKGELMPAGDAAD